jgi:hypothetical protein
MIASRYRRELSETAAKSLWIPHRLARRSWRHAGLWPSDRSHRDFVALIGAEYLSRSPKNDVIDPAALERVAQLATEIALRWAKTQQRALDC